MRPVPSRLGQSFASIFPFPRHRTSSPVPGVPPGVPRYLSARSRWSRLQRVGTLQISSTYCVVTRGGPRRAGLHLIGGVEPVEPRHERRMQACRNRDSGGRNCRNCALGRALAFRLRLGHLLDEQGNAMASTPVRVSSFMVMSASTTSSANKQPSRATGMTTSL